MTAHSFFCPAPIVLAFLFFAQFAYAVPAKPVLITLTQPDGTTFQATNHGNAWFHWKETKAGMVIIKNPKTGYYDYAEIMDIAGHQQLAPSGIHVTVDGQQATLNRYFKPLFRKDILPLKNAALKQRLKR